MHGNKNTFVFKNTLWDVLTSGDQTGLRPTFETNPAKFVQAFLPLALAVACTFPLGRKPQESRPHSD